RYGLLWRNRRVSEGFTELFGWFFLPLADLAAIDHHVVLVRGPVDTDRTEGKLLEAHTLLWRILYLLGMIQNISAVTFAVCDMARSVAFYRKLGFELVYGGERAAFSSLKGGSAFVNLAASPGYEHRWWGRASFRVHDADAP